MERLEYAYVITISLPEGDSPPTEEDLKTAIYRGVESIDTEDAVDISPVSHV